MDDKTLGELKAQHGEVHVLGGSGELVVVKPPTRAAWKRFKTWLSDDRRKADAFEALLVDCIVFPSRDEVDKMLDRKPALAEAFGNKLFELAGGGEVEARKA